MYTAGLNPFYASNFSLWSAYCSGGFAMDNMKKPSFCIADILHIGDADGLPGSSALMAHVAPRSQIHSSGSPLRPSPVAAAEATVFGTRGNPASPYHRHGIHLTAVSRTTLNSQQAPPPSSKDLKFGIDRILSTDFDPKVKEASSLRGRQRQSFNSGLFVTTNCACYTVICFGFIVMVSCAIITQHSFTHIVWGKQLLMFVLMSAIAGFKIYIYINPVKKARVETHAS